MATAADSTPVVARAGDLAGWQSGLVGVAPFGGQNVLHLDRGNGCTALSALGSLSCLLHWGASRHVTSGSHRPTLSSQPPSGPQQWPHTIRSSLVRVAPHPRGLRVRV